MSFLPTNTPIRSSTFKAVVGVIALTTGLLGTAALFFVKIPEGNTPPLLVAIGVVLGWGTNVIQSEFGGTSAGKELTKQLMTERTNGEV